jgi:hypothetical protein
VPSKPPLLYVLAAFGLVLGSFGTLYALSSASPFLFTRDQYVSAMRDEAEKQLPLPAEVVDRNAMLALEEREAEVLYDRRGVALPLGAMNLILSLLLFAGAARAMRGHAWGVSAWTLAAAASVPYTLLAFAFTVVESRYLVAAYRLSPGPLAELNVTKQHLKTLVVGFKSGIEVLYFAICWVYLRRPALKRLFEAEN